MHRGCGLLEQTPEKRFTDLEQVRNLGRMPVCRLHRGEAVPVNCPAMPPFSMHVSYVSRRAGSSAVRHAAYRAGERIWDERASRMRDYTTKLDVVHAEVLAPGGTPEWMRDRSRLWNGVEAAERRKDSRLAQEVYVAIPREVRPEKRVDAIREFVQDTFVAKGMIADFAIHAPSATDGREDPHAHVMLTTRHVEGDGFGLKCRVWDHPARIAEYRLAWERHANQALARSGSIQRVDARSLRAQRRDAEERLRRAIARRDRGSARYHARATAILDRIPEIALGRAASHMEKQGRQTERGKKLREIREANAQTRDARIRKGIETAMREIGRLERSDRMERLRAEIKERAIHALPVAMQRRVYLRRNRRRLARATAHAIGSPGQPVGAASHEFRGLGDRGLEHIRPPVPQAPLADPAARVAVERDSAEAWARAPDSGRACHPIRTEPGKARRTGSRETVTFGTAEWGGSESSAIGGGRPPGRAEPDPQRDTSERFRTVGLNGSEPPEAGPAHDIMDRFEPLSKKRDGAERNASEAQERLQQWLDGKRTSVPRAAGRKREFGLERD